jgi:hypothetical protein
MDPYIEAQEWEDFHTRYNTVAGEMLAPYLEPRYVVRVERRIYVEHVGDDVGQPRRADVALISTGKSSTGVPRAASAATVVPVECLLPMPIEHRETFLVIRERETLEVVTVVETLSPANKASGSAGRGLYLRKRDEILESKCHLVELDLLRGGLRLPVVGELPPGDYHAIVSRQQRRPRAEVYTWTVRVPLPTIPIPLKEDEADAALDLQRAFSTVYDRARYHLSIDYGRPLAPPLSDADEAWAREQLSR